MFNFKADMQLRPIIEILRNYWFAAAAGGAAALVAMVVLLRSRRKTDEQRERERRQRVNIVGRITDGSVSDVQELDDNGRAMQLIVYHYNVAGVEYECSQDVTSLRHLVDLQSCRLGVATSVRYDPVHPGNSIVITEGWSGLRK